MDSFTEKMVNRFIRDLRQHALNKARLYDGVNTNMSQETALLYAAEELGEVASAMQRQRHILTAYEAIDLAHCAMLVWMAVRREHPELFDDIENPYFSMGPLYGKPYPKPASFDSGEPPKIID